MKQPLPLPEEIVSMKSHMITRKNDPACRSHPGAPTGGADSIPGEGFFFRTLGVLLRVRSFPRAAIFLALVSCSGSAAPQAETPESAPSSAEEEPEKIVPPSEDWGLLTYKKVILLRQSLVLELPQGESWVTLPGRGTWSGLRHEQTKSEIWVRHNTARRTITVGECESEARLGWPEIRNPDPDAISRPLRAPHGYGGHLNIVLNKTGGGRVEAFSVGASRCLSVVFLTEGAPGFPERLRSFASEVLETMRIPALGERGLEKRMSP